MTPTRLYFEKHARSFDRVYAPGNLVTRLVRRGPGRRLGLAVSVVSGHPFARVLDVGCGPGRVAEAVLDAGAATYVGIDASPQMLALARDRLRRFASVDLVEGDFLETGIDGQFDVVLALGLFDYLPDPARAAAWLRRRCASELVASFTRWDWVKGPLRHFRYEVLHRCPIYDYTEARVDELLRGAGFSDVEFAFRGPHGFLVTAGVR